jgi:DNA-binding transcriptional ArsR family regulator
MVNDPRTLVTASSAPSDSTSSPSFPRPLTDPAANLIAGRLRVLGQPLRVKLVDRLAAEATTVQELVDALGTTQQNISQHLRLLRRAGVVARRKEGTHVHYRVADPDILTILERAEASLARNAACRNEPRAATGTHDDLVPESCGPNQRIG